MTALFGPLPPGDTADEQYHFIVGLCDKGHHELAVREARSFLDDHPRHAKAVLARYRLATSLFELERMDEARTEYVQLARIPDFEWTAEVNFRLGQCELRAGNDAAACDALGRVLQTDAQYLVGPATFFLAEARFRQDDMERAQRRYGEVLALDANGTYSTDARYGLAWCAFRLGDMERAVQRIDDYLERESGSELAGEMHFLRGEAFMSLGNPRNALGAYEQVRGGAYDAAALRGSAFALSELGDHRQAAERFAAVLQRFPESEYANEARLHTGIEWLQANDAQRARSALSAGELSSDPEALYWLARAELTAGAAEQALASAERALEITPDGELNTRLELVRGDALSALGRGAEAARAFERSGTEYATYAAAVEALNAGRPEDAVRLAVRLIEDHPESTYRNDTLVVLGEGLFARGQHADAARAFEQVLAGDPEPALRARATARRAWCFVELGDHENAARLFADVVNNHGGAVESTASLYMLGHCLEQTGDAAGSKRAWEVYVGQHREGKDRSSALMGLARVDPDHATTWMQQLVGEDPGGAHSGEAFFQLAESASRGGDCNTAMQNYRAVLQNFEGHARTLEASYGLAWCLHQAEEHGQAAALLETVIADDEVQDTLRIAALELLVWTYRGSGDGEGVARAYQAFVLSAPDPERAAALARVTVGAMKEQGRSEEALSLVDGVLQEVRRGPVAYCLLVERAWLNIEAEDVDQAERTVRTAFKIERPEDASALGEVCFFVGEARFDTQAYDVAAELYELALSASSGEWSARTLYKLGFTRLRLEQWDAAAEAFTTLTQNHPRSELFGEGLFLAGEAHYRAERYGDAAQMLATLRRDVPEHELMPKALFRLGVALGRLERWPESELVLTELRQKAPEFDNESEAELWRGRALRAQGKARAARQAFDRVTSIDKSALAAQARLELGGLYVEAGKDEDALAEYLKVTVLYAHDAEVSEAYLNAGLCLERLGDDEGAANQYREVIESYGESKSAAQAQTRLAELGKRG